jgi:hypothetical protein
MEEVPLERPPLLLPESQSRSSGSSSFSEDSRSKNKRGKKIYQQQQI